MAYGNSPLLGASIDPRLFAQDFSGHADAAKTQALGLMSLGNAVGDYFKQQKDQKNALKASQAQIEAAATLFPDQAPYLQGISQHLKDEDTPLSQRAALAGQVGELINMGVNQQRYNTELGFKQRDQDLQERQANMQMAMTGDAWSRQSQQQALDDKTQSTLGPELLKQTLALSNPDVAKSVQSQIGSYTPAEQFKLSQSLAGLLPKTDDREPVIKDFDTPDGGKLQLQLNRKTGSWEPIQVSPDTTAFIANLEGYTPQAYSDSGQTSIGYGTRAKPGEKTITKDEADKRLREELAVHGQRVDEAAKANGLQLNPNQRTALVSFDYNTGAGADLISRFAKDPTNLVAKMAEYNKLDKGDANPAQGLVDRRNKEIALFNTPAVGVKPPPGTTPKEAAELRKAEADATAAENKVGKQERERTAQTQGVDSTIAKSEQFISDLDSLKNHKGFSNLFGSNIGTPTWVPGSAGADAKTLLEMLKAQGFLEAIKTFKTAGGSGALSDAEGARLDAAFLGLNPRMSEEAAKSRIETVKTIVNKAIANMKGSLPADAPATQPAAINPAADFSLRLRTSANQATQ